MIENYYTTQELINWDKKEIENARKEILRQKAIIQHAIKRIRRRYKLRIR